TPLGFLWVFHSSVMIFTPEAGRLEQVGLIESRVVIPEANRRISGQAIAEGFYVARIHGKQG
ncbi:MAG: hypothetical protein ACKO4L_18750, partial [Nodosilinea sp.]